MRALMKECYKILMGKHWDSRTYNDWVFRIQQAIDERHSKIKENDKMG